MELQILKSILSHKEYEKYGAFIHKKMFGTKATEYVFDKIVQYHQGYSEDLSVESLREVCRTSLQGAPLALKETVEETINNLTTTELKQPTQYYFDTLRTQALKEQLIDAVDSDDLLKAEGLMKKINEAGVSTLVEFDAIDADDMRREVNETSQWEWGLPSMQRYVEGFGPERSLLVYARSNGGKTSFISSQVTHFMRQGAKVLHFSISEDTKFKLNERYIQAAYNISSSEFLEDIDLWVDRFNEDFSSKLAIRNVSSLSIRDAEAAIAAFEPDIVVYDQYQKVGVSSKVEMRSDEHLTLIVQRLKALAKDYRHGIICGTQAASSAEQNNFSEPKPKKWLSQLDVAGSKSGVPGEFQTMIGIGQDNAGLQPFIDAQGKTLQCYARYISMPKNKGEMGNFTVYMEPFKNIWGEYNDNTGS